MTDDSQLPIVAALLDLVLDDDLLDDLEEGYTCAVCGLPDSELDPCVDDGTRMVHQSHLTT